MGMDFDLLIRGGRVVDPRNGRDGIFDVAIAGSEVAEVAPEIDPSRARALHPAQGRLVLPGIIDTEVHLAGSGGRLIGHRDLARAGVTTALEFSGYRRMLDLAPEAGAGITVAGIQVIGPYDGATPSHEALRDTCARVVGEGALGVKILGGHYPSTPEATARIIEVANALGIYVGYHCGTTSHGSDLAGFREMIELVGPHAVQIAHVNAYLRGLVADPLEENLEALQLLRSAPHIVSESHLAPFNGCGGTLDGQVPHDHITRNCLRLRGYSADRDGLRRAFADGYAHVNLLRDGAMRQITGEEGLALFDAAQGGDIGLSFPVNLRLSALMSACARVAPSGALTFEGPGRFVVDALTSDGGTWRNLILAHGLDMVRFGAMTLAQFVEKAAEVPARMLALPSKGHLAPGADADLLVVDPQAGAPELTVAMGQVVMVHGTVLGRGYTLLTTEAGVPGMRERGVPHRVVDLAQSWLYRKREAAA
jgi:cytosine/adenosine deaminase-related metal-dependent hydrolase